MAKKINQLTERLASATTTPGSTWFGTDHMYGTPGSFKMSVPEIVKLVLVRGAAAPISGTWAQGDIIWNSAPAAAGTIGWVCTAGGTPGTWKTFGTIAS